MDHQLHTVDKNVGMVLIVYCNIYRFIEYIGKEDLIVLSSFILVHNVVIVVEVPRYSFPMILVLFLPHLHPCLRHSFPHASFL